MRNWLKFAFFINFSIVLSACGGGGSGSENGGGRDNDEDSVRFTVSRQSIEFQGIDGGLPPSPAAVTGTIIGSTIGDLYIFIELTGAGVVADAYIDEFAISDNSETLLIFPAEPGSLGQGTHNGAVTIKVCADGDCESHITGSPRVIDIVYVVGYDENITDTDGDHAVDAADAFPNDPTETADNDGDGTGNNADPDDDNDGAADTADAFPFDAGETLDTDGDLVGNNADANDDGDLFDDVDDPLPLDGAAPGVLTGFSPGFIIAGQTGKVLLTGLRLSSNDTFYVNGVETDATVISPQGVEIELTAGDPGTIDISIQYEDYPQVSTSIELPVISALYYPYAVMENLNIIMEAGFGYSSKAYFDPLTQSLFVHVILYTGELNYILSRHKYAPGGSWQKTSMQNVQNLRSIALSHDNKTLVGIISDVESESLNESDSLVEIDVEGFTIGDSHPITIDSYKYLSQVEFDYAKRAIITTGIKGSGNSEVLLFDLNPDSDTYATQSRLGNSFFSLSNAGITPSGDGRLIMLGENGGSPTPPMRAYRPLNDTLEQVISETNYHDIDIDVSGDLVLINDTLLYDENFSPVGELAPGAGKFIRAAAVSRNGEFMIAAGTAGELYWFDTRSPSGGAIAPTNAVQISEDTGIIRELIITDDGLTVFAFGQKKILLIPVWQIVEGALGSPEVCPPGGCGDIPVASGVPVP